MELARAELLNATIRSQVVRSRGPILAAGQNEQTQTLMNPRDFTLHKNPFFTVLFLDEGSQVTESEYVTDINIFLAFRMSASVH